MPKHTHACADAHDDPQHARGDSSVCAEAVLAKTRARARARARAVCGLTQAQRSARGAQSGTGRVERRGGTAAQDSHVAALRFSAFRGRVGRPIGIPLLA
eukprot:5936491-Pleurochrysis_carterae.AAC.1